MRIFNVFNSINEVWSDKGSFLLFNNEIFFKKSKLEKILNQAKSSHFFSF